MGKKVRIEWEDDQGGKGKSEALKPNEAIKIALALRLETAEGKRKVKVTRQDD